MERLILVLLFAFLVDITFKENVKVNECNGKILILETERDSTKHLLVNLYNANTEFEKLKLLKSLSHNLLQVSSNCSSILNLNHMAEIRFLKTLIYNILRLNETFDLCNIRRVKNLDARNFTFTQKHFSAIIQRA